MTREEFKKELLEAVEGYIAEEETYSDNARLQIDPETLKATIVDDDEADDEEYSKTWPSMDYYDVMDFVRMDPENPGKWLADKESVDSVADEYFKK